jgi:hypothetical protein
LAREQNKRRIAPPPRFGGASRHAFVGERRQSRRLPGAIRAERAKRAEQSNAL